MTNPMWLIVQVQFTPKLELSYHDWSERMQPIMKTKQDNDVADRAIVISIEYNT